MQNFVYKIFIVLVSLSFLSCSDEPNESDLVKIDAPTPLVILVDRELIFSNLETLTLQAPSAVLNFESINNSTRLVTVIGSTFIVTDPLSGSRKVITLDFQSNNTLNYLGVIFPSRDTNCDGTVDDAEAGIGEGPEIPCTAITVTDAEGTVETTPVVLFDSRTFYLSGMSDLGNGSSGADVDSSVSNLYRGLSFPVQGQLEGWFGEPDGPERNFFTEFFFTTIAN